MHIHLYLHIEQRRRYVEHTRVSSWMPMPAIGHKLIEVVERAANALLDCLPQPRRWEEMDAEKETNTHLCDFVTLFCESLLKVAQNFNAFFGCCFLLVNK